MLPDSSERGLVLALGQPHGSCDQLQLPIEAAVDVSLSSEPYHVFPVTRRASIRDAEKDKNSG